MLWSQRLRAGLLGTRAEAEPDDAVSPEMAGASGTKPALLPTSSERPRVGDIRSPRLWQVLVGLSGLVFVVGLYVTSSTGFLNDEWDYIFQFRPSQTTPIWVSHNEHWSTIPILIWKLLFMLGGIRSHIPFEAAALATHLACVFLLFALVRRRSGDIPAFAAALTLLVLGSGGDDIVWAFQIAWTGSVAFGLLAMLLLDGNPPFPNRLVPVSAALLGSVMCSGIGLAFLAAVAAELAFDRQRRRFLLVLVVPVAAYGEWFLAFGRGVPGSVGLSESFNGSSGGLAYLLSVASFVASGLEATAGGAVGWAGVGAAVLPLFGALLILHWYRQRRLESWQIAMVAGLLIQYVLTGLVRAKFGADYATQSRYVYVGVVFLLPLLADAAKELPWYHFWRPALTLIFVTTLLGNATQLLSLASSRGDLTRTANADLHTIEVFRGAPDMALGRSVDTNVNIFPQVFAGRYFAATDELGSPVPIASLGTLPQWPGQDVDRAMINLFGDALTVKPDGNRSTKGLRCVNVDSTGGSTMDLVVPAGQSLMMESSKDGDAFFFLGFMLPPTSEPLRHALLPQATPEWVYLPNTGKATAWRLRVRTTAVGVLRVCGPTSAGVVQVPETGASFYSSKAAKGALDPNWSLVSDNLASGGRAAKLARGTQVSSSPGSKIAGFMNDVFGPQVVPKPGAYDAWFRVRVGSPAGTSPEIKLGVWDDLAGDWAGSSTLTASQASTSYSWVRVAARITPVAGHTVQFLASFIAPSGTSTLGTDWYIDEAIMVPITGPHDVTGSPTPNNIYSADAAVAAVAPWSSILDGAASSGHAAKLASGTTIESFTNDIFGAQIVPVAGAYDVWFRVKVSSSSGTGPEMTLGLWDDSAGDWVGSTRYSASQVGTTYTWAKVAPGITPIVGDNVQFQASFTAPDGKATLSTDWYIDEAVMVPSTAPIWPANG